jgi:quinolinate synthase
MMIISGTRSEYTAALSAMRGTMWDEEDLIEILDIVEEIRALKREKNAVVLAHYYMSPEIQVLDRQGGIADFLGDSLGLSQAATTVQHNAIIFCGVRFMAETAKILNPTRTVLLPDLFAGCSLAESITPGDVRMLRDRYPDSPVMTYVNTYADTKAESDICCTSRNALAIAKALPGNRIIFIPDKFMGRNLRTRITAETGKELVLWNGKCEVHEQFTPERIGTIAAAYPDAEVLVHWEVPDETVATQLVSRPGLVGSTTDIIAHVGKSRSRRFIIGSECDLGAALRGMFPKKEFITPCISCPHMKRITLENTRDALRALGTPRERNYTIDIAPRVIERASKPIQRMLEYA